MTVRPFPSRSSSPGRVAVAAASVLAAAGLAACTGSSSAKSASMPASSPHDARAQLVDHPRSGSGRRRTR